MLHQFLYADITGPIVDFCVSTIESAGLAGVFLLMAAGSACIPIPSEAVMLFAGFSVSNGDQTMLGIVLAGLGGNMVGSWLTYAIGYYGRIDLLEKNGGVKAGNGIIGAFQILENAPPVIEGTCKVRLKLNRTFVARQRFAKTI
ncbi:MAG: hypothetical protein WBM00_07870 [Solirubrobacterales bacterium]